MCDSVSAIRGASECLDQQLEHLESSTEHGFFLFSVALLNINFKRIRKKFYLSIFTLKISPSSYSLLYLSCNVCALCMLELILVMYEPY